MNSLSLADTSSPGGSAILDRDSGPMIAIIIPACDEAPCISRVLDELLCVIDPAKYVVAVGVNASSDRTAEFAREYPVVVAETSARGYGFGCQAAIDAVTREHPTVEAYIFFAADGASDPRDVFNLTAAYAQGYSMVLGARTMSRRNWRTMSLPHVLANFALGLWCGLLTQRWFSDLAPHRLIARDLFEAIGLREMTFGWTIEAQIAAAILGARVVEVAADERKRIAGEQKVSGVTWRQTFHIGCQIAAAGWRTRLRLRAAVRAGDAELTTKFLVHSGRGA
ncbi:MAG: glycosyltransferase family 2 protein [Chthoniobacterales bacterium]